MCIKKFVAAVRRNIPASTELTRNFLVFLKVQVGPKEKKLKLLYSQQSKVVPKLVDETGDSCIAYHPVRQLEMLAIKCK